MRNSPLLLAAIIMPSCAIVVAGSVVALLTSRTAARPMLDELKIAEAYSCAYVEGQHSVMNGLPAVFPGERSVPSWCGRFREIAARNGFKN